MGQKVSPTGLRLGINKTWSSKWFENKDYADTLYEDIKIRKYLEKFYKKPSGNTKKTGGRRDSFDAGISKVEIVRYPGRINIFIYTSRAGVIIGPKGARVEEVKGQIQTMTNKPVKVSIKEVKQPDLDASIVAQNVARQIEMRVSYKRAMKQSISQSMRSSAKGIKISVAGRLGGAEMARRELYKDGSIPLHTLRADIDYATATAATTYGAIGIKVWIYKGEVFSRKDKATQDDAGKVIRARGEE